MRPKSLPSYERWGKNSTDVTKELCTFGKKIKGISSLCVEKINILPSIVPIPVKLPHKVAVKQEIS